MARSDPVSNAGTIFFGEVRSDPVSNASTIYLFIFYLFFCEVRSDPVCNAGTIFFSAKDGSVSNAGHYSFGEVRSDPISNAGTILSTKYGQIQSLMLALIFWRSMVRSSF